MVNTLDHWLRFPFCTISWIPLRGLSGFLGIGFRIPLRAFSGFWVPPELVFPAHPPPIPVHRFLSYLCPFLLLWHIWVSLLYGAILGGVLWHSPPGFSFPLPRIRGNGFVRFCLWPNKISCILHYMFFAVPLTMLLAAVLYVATGVGGFWWPISARAVLMEVAFWKFSNKPTSSASVADAIIFLMMLHSTCTGTFSRGISWIGVLDFGPRKKHPLDLLCASGSDM